jgi:hypothetical protein
MDDAPDQEWCRVNTPTARDHYRGNPERKLGAAESALIK